jgi:hypothetical protein
VKRGACWDRTDWSHFRTPICGSASTKLAIVSNAVVVVEVTVVVDSGTVGAFVGGTVGAFVGDSVVGTSVGTTVGAAVGTSVGPGVGEPVEGALEGELVDGDTVGNDVGRVDGADVGDSTAAVGACEAVTVVDVAVAVVLVVLATRKYVSNALSCVAVTSQFENM